ncbi:MAG: PLP-dependent aminotransferase family protein [bacterium]
MTTSGVSRRTKVATAPDILAHVPIDRAAGVPLHQQIYDGVRHAILSGSLRPGQRLPSTRTLATELKVSRLPVLTAYDQLLHEGYLDGRVGSGTFVSAAMPDDVMRSIPLSSRSSATPAKRGSPAKGRTRGEGGLKPFRVSLPALSAFPHTTWARLVARHAHAMKPALMAYGNPAGLGALRSAIAEHLRTARAVRCEADQVLIVSGSQAALRICASVLLKRGDSVAIEEPGYQGARVALGTTGAQIVPVSVDDDGVDVSALAALGNRIRAAYVTPSHQYPLGASMSAARRLALLDWAGRRNAWIIEDDYDSEYRYVSRPLGALQGMDDHARVVYVGTFSKVLFPALRIGYVVVPSTLWNDFIDAREAFDLFSPTLYQLALTDFLNEGHFARHLRRMRTLYLSRRKALLAGLARHCDGLLTVHNADAGLHIATLLANGVNDVAVVERMVQRGLTATALSTCYAGSATRSGLLLGFGGWSERRIGEATAVLAEILREFA